MEHFYETVGPENWFSYAEFYRHIIQNIPDNSTVVEIGCWRGRATACLGVEIINSGKNIELFCVDPWYYFTETEQPVSCQEDFDIAFHDFMINTKLFNDFLTVMRNASHEAAPLFEDESIDFIFIDASHYYKDIKNDIETWLPKVKKGGIIAGHDYRTHEGVKKAVDELLPEAENITEQNIWYYDK